MGSVSSQPPALDLLPAQEFLLPSTRSELHSLEKSLKDWEPGLHGEGGVEEG